MDPKKLEQIKDVFACTKIADIVYTVDPERGMELLKQCLKVAIQNEMSLGDKTQSSGQRSPQY